MSVGMLALAYQWACRHGYPKLYGYACNCLTVQASCIRKEYLLSNKGLMLRKKKPYTSHKNALKASILVTKCFSRVIGKNISLVLYEPHKQGGKLQEEIAIATKLIW